MQEQIFEMLFNQDDVTWQTIIYDLVREEKMDPWDVDISLLSKRFLEMLQKLKKLDFRASGKIILAAAILLRMKSTRLIDEDLAVFDRLLQSNEDIADEFYEELEQDLMSGAINLDAEKKEYALIPRTPQPRKRKVSVFDLVEALSKALEVKDRRHARPRSVAPTLSAPKDVKEISLIIDGVYANIQDHYAKNNETLSFSQLIPSDSKEDKVYTFIPLLHLDNQRKVDLGQKEHFGEIMIDLVNDKSENTKENTLSE